MEDTANVVPMAQRQEQHGQELSDQEMVRVLKKAASNLKKKNNRLERQIRELRSQLGEASGTAPGNNQQQTPGGSTSRKVSRPKSSRKKGRLPLIARAAVVVPIVLLGLRRLMRRRDEE